MAVKELGYGKDIYGMPIYDIFRKVFQYQDNQFKIVIKNQKCPEETIAYRKNQTCFPVEIKVSIVNSKRFYVGLCTAVNITEKKEAICEVNCLKNEWNEFNHENNEIMANIAHELRTPVNGIMGFNSILLGTELNEEQEEAAIIIKRCCTTMNKIINDFLDYSKMSTNNLVIEQRDFNFRDFIKQIIEFNSVQIYEKGLKLLVEISDEIPEMVRGDDFRLAQILNNLFSNAIKFTSVGHIGLEITKVSETDRLIELFFMVFDTGVGISSDELDKLFKRFSQADSSITRRFGGTGLGLSICKMLVETMNGQIEVDSEKNKGSTFSFSVQLDKHQETMEDTYDALKKEEKTELEQGHETAAKSYDDYMLSSEIDYISMKLQEVNSPPLQIMNGRENMRRAMKEMVTQLEKLIICIEMENWEKAKELAYKIKSLVPLDHTEVSKNIFRLILALGKENYEVSLSVLNEIRTGMREEV
jgi:signal transduction histidine kinase